MIQISKEKYNELVEDQAWLRCLDAAGVDNWSGIDLAHEMKEEMLEEMSEEDHLLEKAKNKFELVLGDWSRDGHGMYESYVVETSATVEDFRDAYVTFNERHPLLNLEELCADYEDSSFKEEQAKLLNKLGFKFDEEDLYIDTDMLADLTMWACNFINPELDYEFITDNIPTFHNYGFDEKGRHIHGPGYGCFEL